MYICMYIYIYIHMIRLVYSSIRCVVRLAIESHSSARNKEPPRLMAFGGAASAGSLVPALLISLQAGGSCRCLSGSWSPQARWVPELPARPCRCQAQCSLECKARRPSSRRTAAWGRKEEFTFRTEPLGLGQNLRNLRDTI